MPESPIVVYPMSTGSIEYKGIRFSVTLRIGGTFAMAIALMDEFAAHKELIAANCLVQVQQPVPQPTLVPQTALPQAVPAPQPTAGEPDGKGRMPGGKGSTVINGIEASKKNGKVTIELWGAGKFAEHYLRQDSEHAFVAALGYPVAQMEIGTRYGVNWTADWVVSSNRASDGKGNYYLNVTGIRDNAATQRIA